MPIAKALSGISGLYLSCSMYSLSNKTVAVTGGFGQIGAAVCLAFARCGAKVFVLDSAQDRWADFRNDLAGEGLDAAFYRADVTHLSGIAELVAASDSEAGGFDIWVNSAYPRTADWSDGPETANSENWSANVTIQMTSACVISNEIAKLMAGRGFGSIINIASIYGVVGPDFSIYDGTDLTMPPAYAAIKGGLINYSRYLASYWGPQGVRVNALCPGGVFSDQPTPFVEAYCRRTALRRMATPDDIAGPVVFLASEAANYVTGTTLMVDGGWTAI